MIPVLEIGGTHVTAALVDPRDGRVSSRTREPLDADGAADAILAAVRHCADGLSVPVGARWGVAVPGPFDYARGIALFRGVGKFEALYGMDVRRALLHGLRQRPGDVVFLNDAHAFLTGEWSAGSVRGHRRAVGITLGTGVGSAFLADGLIHDTGPGIPPEGRMDLTEIDGFYHWRPPSPAGRSSPATVTPPPMSATSPGEPERAKSGPGGYWTTPSPDWASRWPHAWRTSTRPPWWSGAPWPAPGTSSPPPCPLVSRPGVGHRTPLLLLARGVLVR